MAFANREGKFAIVEHGEIWRIGEVMSLPKTRNVGKIIHELEMKGTKQRSRKQIVAIALSQARKSGANIPKKGRY